MGHPSVSTILGFNILKLVAAVATVLAFRLLPETAASSGRKKTAIEMRVLQTVLPAHALLDYDLQTLFGLGLKQSRLDLDKICAEKSQLVEKYANKVLKK